jgi:hypothetical protein
VKVHPEGAGCDGNPRWRLEIAAGETRLTGLSSYPSRSAVRLGFAPKARRSETVEDGLKRSLRSPLGGCANKSNTARSRAKCYDTVFSVDGSVNSEVERSADLGAKAAETLRSARSGGPGPSGEAAALRGTGGTETGRRGGCGAVRFAVEAEVCGAMGCGRTRGLLVVPTDDGRLVLCPYHARRYDG